MGGVGLEGQHGGKVVDIERKTKNPIPYYFFGVYAWGGGGGGAEEVGGG